MARIAFLFVAAATLSIPGMASARAASLGTWQDAHYGDAALQCVISQQLTPTTRVYIAAIAENAFELTVADDTWAYTDGQKVTLGVGLDKLQITDDWSYSSNPRGVRVMWPGMAYALLQAHQLTVQGGGLDLTVELSGAGDALRAIQRCAAQLDPPTDEGEGVDGDVPLATSNAPSSDSELNRELASDIAKIIADDDAKVLAEYVCDVPESAVWGIFDPSGRSRTATMTLSVMGNGDLDADGQTIPVAQALRNDDDEIIVGIYSAKLFATETSKVPQTMLGVSQEDLSKARNFVNAMVDQLWAGRDRLLSVSVATDKVQFFELDQTGTKPVNLTRLSCVRTR